ncbi:Asp23/Gls24 family envelope stress response protein [Desulfosporosinus shakirovi]|uniref:Asp23/Gls24 family envelope stress response protein n=1 Tax=Desulfosporosinus shakirovi TaxID=2885154 RepID=UPI001E3AE20C|nr:Asp23/Gls24 family envelope stress response protein [Desulfosporosinus sp. SRJS8]MCB8816502.1 Asp23/Gls24 family envelope stress response protein [Desulfosporosinus sp. SRJS8]
MENLGTDNSLGSIRIADEVVEVIAGLAASEVEGVVGMSGGIVGDLANMLGRNKNLSKGVKVEVGEHEVAVDLFIVVEYGVSIPDVALNVQEAVKEAIESMTGLKVVEANVHVQGVNFKPVLDTKEEDFRLK